MPLENDFISSLEFIDAKELIERFVDGSWPKPYKKISLRNEVRPVDIYCYLGGRFGRPNGVQNFLRGDHSANLIHWEWTLRHGDAFVSFQGHNFRTEVQYFGEGAFHETDKNQLVDLLKQEFATHGAAMATVRRLLEQWVEFINPYQRLRRAIDKLSEEIESLKLEVEDSGSWNIEVLVANRGQEDRWREANERYRRGFALCFGVRSMLPVLAESMVNMILYVLLRPEIRSDERMTDAIVRQPIDLRIKSLFLNCTDFVKQPDYSSDACRQYNSLVNERNDLLHGNVVIDKLKFNEIFFDGNIPLFIAYRSMWERAMGVEMRAVGLTKLREELAIVDDLTKYLLSCIEEERALEIRLILDSYELGLRPDTRRLGILFGPELIDAIEGSPSPDENENGRRVG